MKCFVLNNSTGMELKSLSTDLFNVLKDEELESIETTITFAEQIRVACSDFNVELNISEKNIPTILQGLDKGDLVLNYGEPDSRLEKLCGILNLNVIERGEYLQ